MEIEEEEEEAEWEEDEDKEAEVEVADEEEAGAGLATESQDAAQCNLHKLFPTNNLNSGNFSLIFLFFFSLPLFCIKCNHIINIY